MGVRRVAERAACIMAGRDDDLPDDDLPDDDLDDDELADDGDLSDVVIVDDTEN